MPMKTNKGFAIVREQSQESFEEEVALEFRKRGILAEKVPDFETPARKLAARMKEKHGVDVTFATPAGFAVEDPTPMTIEEIRDTAVARLADGITDIITPPTNDDTQTLRTIEAKRKELRQVAADLDTCNVDRKELVALKEKITGELLAMCDGDQHPLFDRLPEDDAMAPAEPEKWQDTPLCDVPGITTSHAARLADNCIDTVHNLQSRLRADPDRWFYACKGIGPTARTSIEDALNAFIAANSAEPESEATHATP
jgi:hypothetical protein